MRNPLLDLDDEQLAEHFAQCEAVATARRRRAVARPTHFGAVFEVPAVYVVRFPGAVKVGQSARCWTRLGQHARLGALDAVMFEVETIDHPLTFTAHRPLRDAEQLALAAARTLASPAPHTAELFVGVDYDEVVRLVRYVRAHTREITFPDLQRIHPSARPAQPIGA